MAAAYCFPPFPRLAKVIFLGWALLAANASIGQIDSSPHPARNSVSATYTLRGTVINSVTGDPIRRALVNAGLQMQFTDGQGRFEVSGFPAGRYGITAQKPGYFSLSRLEERRGLMFVTVKGDMSDIVLKLIPEGIISGRITDENGEPMEGVGMSVRGWRIINGRRQQEEFSRQGTDQDGQFRFYDLMPGTYYLTASVMSERTGVFSGFSEFGGYPTTYFPGVTQFNAATPIKLVAGQNLQADFALHRLPAYQVTGEVTGYSGGRLQLLQMGENFDPGITLPVELNRPTGAFVVRGVPAGSYTLHATAEDETGRRLVGQATVSVASSNVSGVVIAVESPVSIPVIVQTESDNPSASRDSAQVTVQLSSAVPGGGQNFFNQNAWSGPTEDKDHGGLVISSVQPGRYNVEVTPTGGWYVQSLLSGSTDLFAEPLTVGTGASAVTIQALLRDDGATLAGETRQDGRPFAATVLAVMQGAPLRTPWVTNTSDQAEFRFENLPPGDYVVLAFDNIADLEYANRDALRDYLSQGSHVTLGSKDSKTINVELIRR